MKIKDKLGLTEAVLTTRNLMQNRLARKKLYVKRNKLYNYYSREGIKSDFNN